MRVRPFFWFLLVLSCAGVLIFAATKPAHAPAAMQVHVDQPLPISVGLMSLELHLTDPQGLPIEQAHVFSHANMTNMDMAVNPNSTREVGQGNYYRVV